MFRLADKKRRGGSEGSAEFGQTQFTKWKKLFQTLPSGKSLDETLKESEPAELQPADIKEEAGKSGKSIIFSDVFEHSV